MPGPKSPGVAQGTPREPQALIGQPGILPGTAGVQVVEQQRVDPTHICPGTQEGLDLIS